MEDEKDQQETEQTLRGLTVPIPKRGTFFENLRRAAEPEKPAEKSPEQ